MKERELLNYQIELNAKFKKLDDLYHALSVKNNMSDSALWILYTLRIVGKPITQSELCSYLFQSKQTINSSLKKLVENEYLTFEISPNNKKNKLIILTEKGEKIVEKVVDPIIVAESNALSKIGDKRRTIFLDIYEDYCNLLKEEFERMSSNG